eukprot:1196227-Prorocentrum_minimum.AAC.3
MSSPTAKVPTTGIRPPPSNAVFGCWLRTRCWSGRGGHGLAAPWLLPLPPLVTRHGVLTRALTRVMRTRAVMLTHDVTLTRVMRTRAVMRTHDVTLTRVTLTRASARPTIATDTARCAARLRHEKRRLVRVAVTESAAGRVTESVAGRGRGRRAALGPPSGRPLGGATFGHSATLLVTRR